MKKNYVITIARGFGSGGKEIGSKLAKELGIPCYERQILKMASEQSGIGEGLFAQVDERLRGAHLTKMLQKVSFHDIAEPNKKDFVSDKNLFKIQARIIQELARTESCVIIGKCANYLLKDNDNVISVYIEAPRAACVKSICKRMLVPEEEAHEMIRKTDKYRAAYYKYYTGGDYWTNAVSYDIVLNSDRIGREQCVELIKQYAELKLG